MSKSYNDCISTRIRCGNSTNAEDRLADAAPDLLEVCKALLLRFDMEPVEAVFPCSAMREDIRAAITRAEWGN